jgi:hypothetical protein
MICQPPRKDALARCFGAINKYTGEFRSLNVYRCLTSLFGDQGVSAHKFCCALGIMLISWMSAKV